MTIKRHIPAVLIASTLLGQLYICLDMVRFEQPELAAGLPPTFVNFRYDFYVHQLGFAGFAITAVGLLILFFPFRKRELWAWFALAVIWALYFFPVRIFPLLFQFPGLEEVLHGILEPGWGRRAFVSVSLWSLMLFGLALSLPRFLTKRGA